VVVNGRLFALAACLTVVCALTAGPALAKTKHHRERVGACNAHRKHVTRKTSKVIVYTKQGGMDQYDGPLTTYYACMRPGGKSIAVGQTAGPDGEYPGNEALSDLTVTGTYVADLDTAGYASAAGCSKFEGPSDPECAQQITYSINGADVKRRRGLQIDLPGGISALAVSPAGAVAWLGPTTTSSGVTLQAMVLDPGAPGHLTGTAQTLDTGAIGSLRFKGLTLSWSNTGVAKSQTLG
jgi:hypothetical protein